MIRIMLSFVLFIFINNKLSAQQLSDEKKAPDSSSTKTGIKKKSPPLYVEQKPTQKKQIEIPKDDHQTVTPRQTVNPVVSEKDLKASETVRIDYKNMPQEVKAKIDNNKARGRYLLEGINKVFLVEIKSCITDADQKKLLSFLKNKKGFIQSQFVSSGMIKLLVEPYYESTDLKDVMSAEGIQFNFINRLYTLKN